MATSPSLKGKLRYADTTEETFMIPLLRMDGTEVVVNAELIATVERTPDTMLTLTTGHHILVKESVEDVVARVVEYRRKIQAGPIVTEAKG
jgi:flagellar protein FlbD